MNEDKPTKYCMNCMTHVPYGDREAFEKRHEAQCSRHPQGGHSSCQCGDNKPSL